MDAEQDMELEERRWLLLLHLLFAITLVIPSVLVVVEADVGAATTLAIAALFAVWYAALYVPMRHHSQDRRLLVLYTIGAIPLYTVLSLREGAYVLVLYALMPQLFSALSRWQAIAGVAALVAVPAFISRDFDLDALFTLVAVVGLGLAITAVVEMLSGRNERQRAVIAELRAARAENEQLADEAAAQGRAAGVLAERQRLAHDIHDTLAQAFTSVVTQLEAAEQALGSDVHVAVSHVDRAKRTAREGLTEARRTVEALRPSPLEQGDLAAAVQRLSARWQDDAASSVAATVVVDGEPVRVPDSVEDAVLRVAQEALTNVARHAEATTVTLTLSYLDDVLLLDVQDDGVGFDPAVARGRGHDGRSGFGLTSMSERIALVGGALTVESVAGEGTTIAARAPIGPPPPGVGAARRTPATVLADKGADGGR